MKLDYILKHLVFRSKKKRRKERALYYSKKRVKLTENVMMNLTSLAY